MTGKFLIAALVVATASCSDRSNSADTSAPADTSPAVGQTAAGGDVQPAALLDPNAATREQLAAVPGLDTAAVTVVLAGRPYADMLAVDRALAKTLSPEQRKTVYARVWKPIDLNKAKGEEILLIPGVGNRMKHEFEEYRPYTSIEQFRREIGKYVDRNEVARLERYVAVNP
jgi:DNA uptake protein ComE-like DNA-binding protein